MQYTVVSTLDRHYLTPLAAIPGRHDVAGASDHDSALHITHVAAGTPDGAMQAVRAAARLIGTPAPQDRLDPSEDGQWTAVGLVDRGYAPGWRLIAVLPGAHEVQGGWDSMLSGRWHTVVDAAGVEAARSAADAWAYAAYTDED